MGYITATPGNAVDFDYIEDYILRMRDKYDNFGSLLGPVERNAVGIAPN